MYVPKYYLDFLQPSLIIFVDNDQLTFGSDLVFDQSIGVANTSTGISSKFYSRSYIYLRLINLIFI